MSGVANIGGKGANAGEFWHNGLEALTPEQWEALCDGCGRCCLVKLEDEDTGQVHFTDIGCKLLDGETCACRNYPQRQNLVPDCIALTPEKLRDIGWLPPTCAYRLVAEGRDLMWWHYLKSGSRETVHETGISVRGRLQGHEDGIEVDDLVDHIVTWPRRVPRMAKRVARRK